MKRKIILSLCALFLIFGSGCLIAAVNIRINSKLFEYVVKLQQIQTLRQDLVQSVLKSQADLYAVNTPLESDLDAIVQNVASIDAASTRCTSCHHDPEIAAKLHEIEVAADRFKEALSFYITASADRDRILQLKQEAALAGNRLLSLSETLTVESNSKIEETLTAGMKRLEKARILLFSVILLSCLLGIAIAVHLTRSITRPIHDMLRATRRIAGGELGYTISHGYRAEFGELAENFNSMSTSLQTGYSVLQKEIHERRETEKALRKSEERYALAAQGANDGLWDWDLSAGDIYYSSRWKSMLGYADLEIGSSPREWLGRVHEDDRPRLEAKIAAHVGGSSPHLEDEIRMMHRNGTWRWVLTRGMAVKDSAGVAYRMAGSQTDVTERRLAEEQLLHDAFHDALTGLPNRPLFMNRLKHVITLNERRQDNVLFAVLFLDLDRFKVLNDSLGHLVGDQILIAVGKRLPEFVRPSDTVARLGGDEFAILLEDIKREEVAIQIAARIRRELPRPFDIGGHEVFTTASIGIAFGTREHTRPEQILRDADLAMYQAKANGKNRVEIFDRSMQESTVRRLQLETDLRKAIEREEFRLHYQPICCVRTGEISGFEALLRWEHPTRGLVYPLEFIPLAEETGLITAIGQWVLREACRQGGEWKKLFPDRVFSVSVNLSSREFTPLLLQGLREMAAESCVDPSVLRIEITERTIMENPQSAAKILMELKELGIGLQIDDFGTGYSSLSYLHQLPFDALKIDRSFISMIDHDREKLEIVKAIINLAANLKKTVIAEGVERPEEMSMIQKLGCESAQGYLIARPMAPESVLQIFNSSHRPEREATA